MIRTVATIGLSIALVATGATTAIADDASKEACIDAHSRGQDAKDQGKISLARKLFLSCAQSACPSIVQGDCARFADELTRTQPTLSFVARDASGHYLPDTTVYIDGVLTVTRLDDGKAHDVDPGAHTIKFIHGAKEQAVTVVVGAGEKGRTVSTTFAEVGVPVRAALDARDPAKPPKKSGPKVTHPFGAKLVIGLGGLLVVGGGTLGVLGLMRVPDNCSVSTHQCAAPPGDQSFADASSAIRLSNLGWITAGVGLAAVAGGMVWYIGGKKTGKEDSVVAAPWVTSDAAGFAVSGRL
jgi:hypothetical protein